MLAWPSSRTLSSHPSADAWARGPHQQACPSHTLDGPDRSMQGRRTRGVAALPSPFQVPSRPGRQRVKAQMEGFVSYFAAFPVCGAPFYFSPQRTPAMEVLCYHCITPTRKLRHRKVKGLPLVTQGCALSPDSVWHMWSTLTAGYRHCGPSGEDQELRGMGAGPPSLHTWDTPQPAEGGLRRAQEPQPAGGRPLQGSGRPPTAHLRQGVSLPDASAPHQTHSQAALRGDRLSPAPLSSDVPGKASSPRAPATGCPGDPCPAQLEPTCPQPPPGRCPTLAQLNQLLHAVPVHGG